MADGTTPDVIIPLTVETGSIDKSLDELSAKVDSLRSKLVDLSADSAEYLEMQNELVTTTAQLTAANAKYAIGLDNVVKAGDTFAATVSTINTDMTDMVKNAGDLSTSLVSVDDLFKQSGESAKEAAQGTAWYEQTLAALREEGGLTNVTLNELKATQKDLQREMDNQIVGSEKWLQYRDAINEVKKAQSDYRNLARDTEGEMKVQTNTIAAMRAQVSALRKEWAQTDFADPKFQELSKNLADANAKLKEQEFAVGITGRDVGNYAGQIERLIPQLRGLSQGLVVASQGTTFLQGGFKSLTIAIKAFLASPLLITVTALVAAFKLFSTIMDNNATKSSERFTRAIEAETNVLNTNSIAAQQNIALMRARGATATEVSQAELRAADAAAIAALNLYRQYLSQYENLSKKAQEKAKETLDNLKKLADDAAKNAANVRRKDEVTRTAEETRAENERIANAKRAYEERKALAEQNARDLANVQSEITKSLSNEFENRRIEEDRIYNERLEILKRNNQSTEDLERLHQETLLQIQKDEDEKRSQEQAAETQRQIDAINAAYQAEQKTLEIQNAERAAKRAEAQVMLAEAEANNDYALREAALARLEEFRIADEEAELLQQEAEQLKLEQRLTFLQEGLENERIIGEERIALEAQVIDAQNALQINAANRQQIIAKQQLAAYKAQADTQKKIDDETAKNKKKTQDTINGFLEAGVAIAGEGTIASKALGVAQATISTYVGATKAMSTLPWPANLAALASTLAAGFMQVKSILAVKIPNISKSSSSADVGSTAMPAINPVVAYQAPIIETHSNITGDEISEINKAQRVYVVESDIADAQKRVAVVDKETSF